jgi:two-component system cell cycle sensor histidine kinase/response regulator CckA
MAQSQKMQAVGQLAGGIAHDFNNVLTAIIMSSDLLLSNHHASDPSFPDIMNIKQNANRAASLVRQLLAFSRRQTLRPEVLDLTDVLADLRMLLARLVGTDIALKIEHGRDLWPVKADLGQFEQVAVNLVVNARDAMPDGGTITVRTRNVETAEAAALGYRELPEADYVLYEVEDSGTGIPADILAKIFEPFFTTKEVGKGTGLGLSMVYGIIKQTGGFIFCDSTLGKGTVFRIYLPRFIEEKAPVVLDANGMPDEQAVVAKKPAPVEKKAEKQADLSGSATVLLVEDEDAVRMGGVRALQTRGYTVHEASSGVEALEVLEELEGKVDIIVSDVVMPEMDGPTLLRELRKSYPNIKFIFVSGYAEDAFAKNLPEDAQFGFLPKPFSLKQLATAVKEMLEKED